MLTPAERQREHRRRQREGAVKVSVELTRHHIEVLTESGMLPDDDTGRDAVAEAIRGAIEKACHGVTSWRAADGESLEIDSHLR